MSHSYSRTLASSLGFQDPDRQNSVHVQAQQFFTMNQVGKSLLVEHVSQTFADQEGLERVRAAKVSAAMETPLTKGSGNSSSVVGFLDTSHVIHLGEPHDNRNKLILGEIKIAPVSIEKILMQVRLYMSFQFNLQIRSKADQVWWYVAYAFDLSNIDRYTLGQHGILPIRLGGRFYRYLDQQNQSMGSRLQLNEEF